MTYQIVSKEFDPTLIAVGDRVLYVMPHNGESRPAIIVKVWRPGSASLQVFTDGGNDGEPNNVRWCPSVEYDPIEKKKGTFHYDFDVVEEPPVENTVAPI